MTSDNARGARGKARLPTTTATPARVALFQPSQRPKARDGSEWVANSWGRCSVDGRLGQRHADVLESLLYVAEVKSPDHRLLVDPYRWRKAAGGGRLMSRQHLDLLVDELIKALVRIETPLWKMRGTLLNSVKEAQKKSGERVVRFNPLTQAETRGLLRVTLGDALVELLRRDYACWYDPAPIARLDTGFGQAIARHCRTHTQLPRGGGWFIDELIQVVADDDQLQGTALREARRAVRRDAAGLLAAGFKLDGDKLYLLEGVGQTPDSVGQTPDSVGQTPDSVGQTPDEMRV